MPHFECGAFDHSATSPAPSWGEAAPGSGRVLGEDGRPDKARKAKFAARGGKPAAGQEWDRRFFSRLAVPCRFIEIAGRKCGFADQPERRNDGSDPFARGNVIPVLT